MLKITGNIRGVVVQNNTDSFVDVNGVETRITGQEITITGSDLVVTNPEWDGCVAEKIVASPVAMSSKLHRDDLINGLVVQMTDGNMVMVRTSDRGIAFTIGGFTYDKPKFDAEGYVLNATRMPTAGELNVAGAITARAMPWDSVTAAKLSVDKPWPRDPRADDLKASDIPQGFVPASWVNPAPATPGVPPGSSMDETIAYRGLQAMQRLAHKTATDAGWYVDPTTGEPIKRNFGEVVALMHSELSEALEADRKSAMDDKLPHRPGTEVEFADCLIRIFDTAAARGLDVAGAAIEKNRFNRDRADHKLANRNAEGGKKY